MSQNDIVFVDAFGTDIWLYVLSRFLWVILWLLILVRCPTFGSIYYS